MPHAPQVERQPISVFPAAAVVGSVIALAVLLTAVSVAVGATSAVVLGAAALLGRTGGIFDEITAAAAFTPPRTVLACRLCYVAGPLIKVTNSLSANPHLPRTRSRSLIFDPGNFNTKTKTKTKTKKNQQTTNKPIYQQTNR